MCIITMIVIGLSIFSPTSIKCADLGRKCVECSVW